MAPASAKKCPATTQPSKTLISDQHHRAAVSLERTIGSQQTHPFGSGLRNQDTVERIAMMARQDREPQNMTPFDRQL